MREFLKSIFEKLGYVVISKESIEPIDLRGQVKNPILAKYIARKHTFLINADFEKCIALFRFSCEKTGNNPLVKTVNNYLQDGSISYSNSELKNFYNRCKPRNVAEMFDLEGECNEDLVTYPANCVVFPWENATMKGRREFRKKFAKYETRQRGKELSMQHGWGITGPASTEWGELEVDTLIELAKSIGKNGYHRGNDHGEDINASVLVNGKDYKYFIHDGNHRISVLSSLDFKTAPLRIMPTSVPSFIYRDEVNFWPNVKRGLYTKEQALKIFDTIFKGRGYLLSAQIAKPSG